MSTFKSLTPPRTGKVKPTSAIATPQANEQIELLMRLLGQIPEELITQGISKSLTTGNELLDVSEEDRLRQNLSTVKSATARERDLVLPSTSNNLVSRGLLHSGISGQNLAATDASIRGKLISDAINRSYQESLASRELGGGLISRSVEPQLNFASLLTNFIQSLLGAGTAGAAQTFASRSAANASRFGTVADLYGKSPTPFFPSSG